MSVAFVVSALSLAGAFLSHIQLVRPRVVAMAVRMEIIMLMTIFQVSFLLSNDIGFVDF
mgnify:FL=1